MEYGLVTPVQLEHNERERNEHELGHAIFIPTLSHSPEMTLLAATVRKAHAGVVGGGAGQSADRE